MSHSKKEFPSRAESLSEVRAFVRQFLTNEGIAQGDGELLVLGINEAFANIIRHAYAGQPPQPIELLCESDGTELRFRLKDFGAPADPAQFRRRPLGEIEPGGLGLHLMEHIFDRTTYLPQPRGTELELIKNLPLSTALHPISEPRGIPMSKKMFPTKSPSPRKKIS